MPPEPQRPRQGLRLRVPGVSMLGACLHLSIDPGQRPTRGALEHLDRIGDLHQFGHDLYRARPGSHDRDLLTLEVVVVIPPCTVDLVSLVGIDASNVRQAGIGERPRRHHHRARPNIGVPVDAHVPMPGRLVPDDVDYVVSESNTRSDVELTHHCVDVIENLTTTGIGVRPVGIGRETVRIQPRRYVAGCARVSVVAPGSTDGAAAFEDRDILDSTVAQSDSGTDSGESRTDDHGVEYTFAHIELAHATGS